VQQHDAVIGQRCVGHLEEFVVAVEAEMLERADRDDPVDRLVELLPALQQHALAAWTVRLSENPFDMGLLVLAEGQADDVDVVFLDGPHHRRAPAAADVEQRHPGLQAQLAQRQVDLGALRLFQRHVVALEVRAAIGTGRVQEQRKEVVGQVVVRLHVLEVRFQARLALI
jgi:hypothetical protein